MPVMDGIEATKKIREIELKEKNKKSHIPIIALTAHAMKGDRERFLVAGMDGYIPKPIDKDMLAQVIDENLKKVQRLRALRKKPRDLRQGS